MNVRWIGQLYAQNTSQWTQHDQEDYGARVPNVAPAYFFTDGSGPGSRIIARRVGDNGWQALVPLMEQYFNSTAALR